MESRTPEAPRNERSGWKRWVAAVAAVALLVLVLQNNQSVEVRFFFATVDTPLVFALAIVGALGALVGWLAPRVLGQGRRES